MGNKLANCFTEHINYGTVYVGYAHEYFAKSFLPNILFCHLMYWMIEVWKTRHIGSLTIS